MVTYTLIYILVIFFACFLQGIVGFGFALIALPIGLFFFGKTTVVTTIVIVGLALNLLLIAKNKHPLNLTLIGPLVKSSIAGMIIGVEVFKVISADSLQLFAGLLVVVYCVFRVFAKLKLPDSKLTIYTAGFLSGFLNTSTSLSAPPVTILLTSQGTEKDDFKKTLSVFFFTMNILTLFLYSINNCISVEGLGIGLLAIPVVLLAGYLGNKVSHNINLKFFHALTLTIIFLTGSYNVWISYSKNMNSKFSLIKRSTPSVIGISDKKK